MQDHPGELTPLSAFLTQALGHLSSQIGAPLGAVGLSFTPTTPSSAYLSLLELGNIFAVSYMPGLGQPIVMAAATPAKDLDAMMAIAGGRPTVLQAVGYTSATALGSTVEMQAERLAAFFEALELRRGSFPIVVVEQLHDMSAEACSLFAVSQGLLDSDPEVQFVCNSGLRGEDSVAKPAWSTFLAAIASYGEQ